MRFAPLTASYRAVLPGGDEMPVHLQHHMGGEKGIEPIRIGLRLDGADKKEFIRHINPPPRLRP